MRKLLIFAFVMLTTLCACTSPQTLILERKASSVTFINYTTVTKIALGSDGKLYIGGSNFESSGASSVKNPPTPLTQKQIDELPTQILPYLAEDNQISGIYNWKFVAENVVDLHFPGPIYYLTGDGKLFAINDQFYTTPGVPVLLADNVIKICRTYPISYITEDGSLMMQTNEDRYINISGAKTSIGISGHPLVKLAENAYDASSWGNRNFAYIDTSGNLWVNGYNDFGTFGNGKYDEVLSTDYLNKQASGTPIAPEGYDYTKFYKALDKVTQVWVQGSNIFTIRDDGSLWGWGANEHGNVGVGSHGDGSAATRDVITKPRKILENVVKFAGDLCGYSDVRTGENAFMALTSDGSLYAWGSNRNGVLANGEMDLRKGASFIYSDTPLKLFSDVKDFTYKLGDPGFMVLKTNGDVYTWGYGSDGGVGNGVKAEITIGAGYEEEYVFCSPTKILTDVVCLGNLSGQFNVVKTDGSVWTWGENPFGWSLYTTRSTMTDPTNIWEGAVFATPTKNPYISATISADGTVSFVPTPVE